MKIVFIDVDNKRHKNAPKLEYGKTYEGNLVFLTDGKSEWENNYLTIEGFSETDWIPVYYFVTLEEWREMKLNEIGIV